MSFDLFNKGDSFSCLLDGRQKGFGVGISLHNHLLLGHIDLDVTYA